MTALHPGQDLPQAGDDRFWGAAVMGRVVTGQQTHIRCHPLNGPHNRLAYAAKAIQMQVAQMQDGEAIQPWIKVTDRHKHRLQAHIPGLSHSRGILADEPHRRLKQPRANWSPIPAFQPRSERAASSAKAGRQASSLGPSRKSLVIGSVAQ